MESNYKSHAVTYLYTKAISDKSKAEASLEMLLEYPAGIGDHSTGDLYETLDQALDILVDAKDRIEVLESTYPKITKGINIRWKHFDHGDTQEDKTPPPF